MRTGNINKIKDTTSISNADNNFDNKNIYKKTCFSNYNVTNTNIKMDLSIN